MISGLPFELLSQIAQYLAAQRLPLGQYELVCRAWQTAFEPFIYRSVTLRSNQDDHYQFKSILSIGDRQYMVKSLTYSIVVPYDLPDYTSIEDEDLRAKEPYMENNHVRAANGKAFGEGFVQLFDTLNTWGDTQRLCLDLQVPGTEQILEPGTMSDPGAGDYSGCDEVRNGDLVPRRISFA
ncbi:hypothetical protein BDW69DRAFT_183992 [Aspergillus filifer]